MAHAGWAAMQCGEFGATAIAICTASLLLLTFACICCCAGFGSERGHCRGVCNGSQGRLPLLLTHPLSNNHFFTLHQGSVPSIHAAGMPH
jgi:hypothetical protein